MKLKSIFALANAILLSVSWPCQATEVKESFSMEITRTLTYNYLVILPDDYNPGRKYPLVLFLHGSGERGEDLELVKKHGPFAKMKDLKTQSILIAPQCPMGERWIPEGLAGLLDQVERTYPIEKSRIYLTGLSMGGFGTWSFAGFQPERFAAIAPICAGGNAADAARVANIPIWAFHGDADKSVTLDKGQEMIDAVRAAGGDPKFTVYPGVGHDSWTRTYNNPEFYDWLFTQKRP